MARRFRGRRSSSRRRQKVVWDTLSQPQNVLPVLTLDSTQARDGAFTSVKRWRGSDVTLLRTIFQCMTRVFQLGFQVDTTAVLEICIGLSLFDSMGDPGGVATNTTIASGTGPLTDADNSRWFARCCVLIPIGQAGSVPTGAGVVIVPFVAPRSGPHSGYLQHFGSDVAAGQSYRWYCEWDSRTKRKLQGAETVWVQLACEAQVSVTPAVGDDITIAVDAFSGRCVKTESGLAETA